jgi:hypothetical protein
MKKWNELLFVHMFFLSSPQEPVSTATHGSAVCRMLNTEHYTEQTSFELQV